MPSAGRVFSAEELRARYQAEREKRLRPEGSAQYISVGRLYPQLDRDPFAGPDEGRAPVTAQADVLIVGAGLGGLLTGVRLRQAGVESIVVVDRAGDFGGTWYWNRYPGAACDVESYVYMPLLEETGYMPAERYAKATEIFAYCQGLARRFDLYRAALLRTEVTQMRWDEDARRWRVATDRGDRIAARFVVTACGSLHKPKLPGIPGVETFAGHAFHTSRWDYGYTGGSPTDPVMSRLADKRVGVIGTGATAVQAIPRLAEAAGRLYVFQRTPAGVGVRGNRPTDPEWAASLRPGWQQERIENFTAVICGKPFERDLVADAWSDLHRDNAIAVSGPSGMSPEAQQLADYRVMEELRARIDATVTDPATAEALKPWYDRMCKRPCFHDEYLQTFNRANVELVDTAGRGVDRITPSGVVVAGVEYPVDCLIFASGFETAIHYAERMGFDPVGRGGVGLAQAWKAGPGTLHGLFSRGFPNWVMFAGSQAGWAVNFTHVIGEWALHAAWVVRRCLDEGIEVVEPTEAAQEAWWDVVRENLPNGPRFLTPQFLAQCTPSYFNAEGRPDPTMVRAAPFNGGALEYIEILRGWRQANDLAGLETTRALAPRRGLRGRTG